MYNLYGAIKKGVQIKINKENYTQEIEKIKKIKFDFTS